MPVSLGLGGGGNMMCPAVSPHDASVMFVACDMSGLYRSRDGGGTWQMLETEGMHGSTRVPVAFHPTNASRIYAFDPYQDSAIRISDDLGDVWTRVTTTFPTGHGIVTALASVSDTSLLVGTTNGIVELNPTTMQFGPPQSLGEVIRILVLRPGSGGDIRIAATTTGVYKFNGSSWVDFGTASLNLPAVTTPDFTVPCGGQSNNSGAPLHDLCGAPTANSAVLYATVMRTATHGAQIYRWNGSWTKVAGAGLNLADTREDQYGASDIARYDWLAMAQTATDTVYASSCGTASSGAHRSTIYRSTDGGASWTAVLTDVSQTGANIDGGWADFDAGDQFGGPARGLAVAPGDPNVVVTSNLAEVYVSTNAGGSWHAAYSKSEGTRAAKQPWSSIGLEVTTTWQYAIDPAARANHYICYTDIGLAQSTNHGATWTSVALAQRAGGGKYNTIYQLAFDGQDAWAACSDQHDIPYGKWRNTVGTPGGTVWRSKNNGGTWSEDFGLAGGGTSDLPNAPVTSVIVTKDASGARTVWAAVYMHGVYTRSEAAGAFGAWSLIAGTAGLRVYRLNALDTGTIVVTVAGQTGAPGDVLIKQPATAGFTSAKGNLAGECPVDVAQITGNQVVVCSTSVDQDNIKAGGGGVYRTLDITASPPTWTKEPLPADVFGLEIDDAFAPQVDPRTGRLIVTTTYHGAFMRIGNAWQVYRPTPFAGAHRIAFDGADHYVSTFGGGAWRVTRNLAFVTDRSTFAKNNVDAILSGGVAKFSAAFYIIIDDFQPQDLGITKANPTEAELAPSAPQVTFYRDSARTMVCPGVTAVPEKLLLEGTSFAPYLRQRLTIQYRVEFTGDVAFLDANSMPIQHQDIAVLGSLGDYQCTAVLAFNVNADPYILDGSIPWLSADICPFHVIDGETVFGQTMLTTDSPQQFLSRVLTSVTPAEFDSVRDTPARSTLQWSDMVGGKRVTNFALARVHMPRTTSMTPIDTSTFFRLFRVAATGLDYQETTTYAHAPNHASKELAGLGTDTGGALLTIPCYSNTRQTTFAQQDDDANGRTLTPTASGNEDPVYWFGCIADVNGQTPVYAETAGGPLKTMQQLIYGRHQCMVGEIWLGSGNKILGNPSPQMSDRLSQRNLAIEGSDNPGSADSRTIIHPIDIRRSHWDPRERKGEISSNYDELMIEWATPPGTSGSLYMPDVDVQDILRIARMRGATTLRASDATTIAFDGGGVTWIPLPAGRSRNIAALLTIVLPEGVRAGQQFAVVIKHTAAPLRRIIGSVQIDIPIRKIPDLIAEEERTLGVAKHVMIGRAAGDPWTAVTRRYTDRIADRVRAFGGNPDDIPPSPHGGPRDQPKPPSCACDAWHAFLHDLRGSLRDKLLAIPRLFGRLIACALR